MAETETPDDSKNVIEVEEEIEGAQIGTRNYRFSKIGESVPIKSDADFKFDMDSLPSRPLAVSERFGAIFVAHTSGFCVARTNDVMDTAKELKNGGKGSCIQELSVVDVPLGKVSILALSADSSMLAASVGFNLHFFSVAGLLNKDLEPSFSKSLNESSCIKDMQWSPHLENKYVVLTSDGNLYRGAGQDDLNNLMDNVDAVNWSKNGKYIAVAKNGYLSILSSKFKEKLLIKLLFDSLIDGDADCVVKVDSVRWVRPDCIMLGCYRLSADGKEENYLLQLISVKDGKITNPSSNPVALAFSDAFLAMNDDDIPFGSGPYMSVSYLDECELAFVANRKNTDQHVVLFAWSSDKENGAEMIEISNDAWLPTINLQDNSDDNLILGLAVDKAYTDEKIRLVLGEEDTEVSPCCVLLCLTVDGKLFMFHFASAIGPSVLAENASSTSDEEEESQVMNIVNNEKQIEDPSLHELQPQKVSVKVNEPTGKDHELSKGGTQQDVPIVRPNNSNNQDQSLSSQKQEGDSKVTLCKASEPVNQEVAAVKSTADSVSKSANDVSNKTPFGASTQGVKVSTELSVNKTSIGLHSSSGSISSGSVFSSNVFGVQHDLPIVKPNNSKDQDQSLPSQKQEDDSKVTLFKASEPVNQEVAVVKSTADSVSKSTNDVSNETPFGASTQGFKVSTQLLVNNSLIGLHGSSGSFSSGSVFSSNVSGVQQDVPIIRPNNSKDQDQSLSLQKQEGDSKGALFKASEPVNQEVAAVKSTADSVSKSVSDVSNKTPFGASTQGFKASTELSINKTSTGLHGSSGSFSSGSLFSSNVFGVQSSSSSGSFSSGGIFSSRTFDVKSFQSPHAAVQENRPDTNVGTTNFSSGPQKFSFSKLTSSQPTSSNLLGQRASSGAGVTNSLPVVSNTQPSLVKSSDFKLSDKGNLRNHTPSRLLNSEPNLSEQRSVEEMAKELDDLLESIERPGGFYDASVAAHKPSVAALEEGIWVLSDRCRKWTDTMARGIEEVQLLLDKTVQVLARRIYMEAIVKQATDSQYLDIWNRQKLSSELEMKRRHILEINQNLINQLIELERHLNTLELQRFGDKSDDQMSRKSFHTKHGPPRHVQSLHSLHNTMIAQLTAAEKLSECLSKQMAVLSIDPEPVKKQNVKKELFDTIGISYDGTTFSSPGQEKTRELPPKSQPLISSWSTAANTDLKKLKSSEPETARRRRDSLDRNWASIEPPKTTVKRMLLQEDRQMSPARLSLPSGTQKPYNRSVISHDIPHGALIMSQSRGSQDGRSNSSLWGKYRSDSTTNPVTSGLSLGFGAQPASIVTQDAARESRDLTAEKSRNRLTFSLKPDPVVVNAPKSSQQSQSFLEPSSNTTKSTNIFQKKPIEYSESNSKDTGRSKFAVADVKLKPVVTESSSIWSRKSPEPSFSGVSSAASSTAFSGKSFYLEASIRESQLADFKSSSIASLPVPVTSTPSFVFKDTATSSTASTRESQLDEVKSSSTASLPVPVTSAPSSFVFKDAATSSTSSAKSSTSFGIKLGATQTTPISASPASFTSFSSSSKLNPDTSESSTPHVVSVPKFYFKPEEKSSGQTSPPQPVVSSGPTSQPSTSSFSESQLNSTATSSPALVSNSKPEQPLVSPPVVSSPPITNPINDSSHVAITQEDEMEEEAPDTTQLSLGNLGGFGLGSDPNPAAPKHNPFGAPFGNTSANTPITSFTASPPSSGLFRPASFSVESQQPSQPPQQTNFNAFSGGFGSDNSQSNAGQGFGQPARIGSGQQALGSVLGSFGQSRQFGAGLPGVASPSPFGSSFGGNQSAGGFATASSGGGGFANLASGGGGFGGLATGSSGFAAAATGSGGFGAAATGSGGFGAAATGGGGFGAAATGGGGFGAAASGGGGFGTAASGGGGFGTAATGGGGFGGAPAAGGGFAGAASGGFGGFSSQGGSGFSSFGSSGTARPPSELFTQMRK